MTRSSKKEKISKKDSRASRALEFLKEYLKDCAIAGADAFEVFLMSACSTRSMVRRLGYNNREFNSTFQSLQKSGYVKRINEDQFLITPKAIKRARMIKVEESVWDSGVWDGFWRIIIFDIPEDLRRERDIYRSLLKRKGFVGIQQSVFIAPFADFDELAMIRSDLGIEEYVSFFLSKSANTDDDMLLRKRFNLK